MSTRPIQSGRAAISSLNGDQADPWDALVAAMPVLAFAWILGASFWSARVVGII